MRINYAIKIYTKVKSNQNSTSSIKARHVQQYLTLRIRIKKKKKKKIYIYIYIYTYTLNIFQSKSVRRGLVTLIIYNDMIKMLLSESEKITLYVYLCYACM